MSALIWSSCNPSSLRITLPFIKYYYYYDIIAKDAFKLWIAINKELVIKHHHHQITNDLDLSYNTFRDRRKIYSGGNIPVDSIVTRISKSSTYEVIAHFTQKYVLQFYTLPACRARPLVLHHSLVLLTTENTNGTTTYQFLSIFSMIEIRLYLYTRHQSIETCRDRRPFGMFLPYPSLSIDLNIDFLILPQLSNNNIIMHQLHLQFLGILVALRNPFQLARINYR